jgi:hypothetical protein
MKRIIGNKKHKLTIGVDEISIMPGKFLLLFKYENGGVNDGFGMVIKNIHSITSKCQFYLQYASGWQGENFDNIKTLIDYYINEKDFEFYIQEF